MADTPETPEKDYNAGFKAGMSRAAEEARTLSRAAGAQYREGKGTTPDRALTFLAERLEGLAGLQPKSITCPKCGIPSYSQGDVQHKFCIKCGFHRDFAKPLNL